MERSCCVPGCNSNRKLHDKKVTFFNAPKLALERAKWSEVLICDVLEKSYICEEHFLPSDIRVEEIFHDAVESATYNYQLKKVLLKGALPFKRSFTPSKEDFEEKDMEFKHLNLLFDISEEFEENEENEENKSTVKNLNKCILEEDDVIDNVQYSLEENLEKKSKKSLEKFSDTYGCNELIIANEENLFNKLLQHKNNLKLPKPEWGIHCCLDKNLIIFSTIEIMSSPFESEIIVPIPMKQVILNSKSEIQLSLSERNFEFEGLTNKVKTIEEVENLLVKIDKLKTCVGGPLVNYFKNIQFRYAYKDRLVWRHNKCPIMLKTGNICLHCLSLKKTLPQSFQKLSGSATKLKLPLTPTTKHMVKNISNKRPSTEQNLTPTEEKLARLI